PLAAAVIFETKPEAMGAWGDVDHQDGGERVSFAEKPGFFDTIVSIGDRSGPKTRLDLPTDAWFRWHRGWLTVKPRTPWTVGGETHAPDTLLGIAFPAFLAGDRSFRRLFEPGPRRSLQGFFWSGGRLVLSILDDLKPV